MGVHDILSPPKSTCEVLSSFRFVLQCGSQQLVRRACEIVFDTSPRFVIEEDQAICVPSDPPSLGVVIYGGLARQPEAVECREDGPKSVICGGCDSVSPGRIGKWLPILLAHRSRSACEASKRSKNGDEAGYGPVDDEDSRQPLHQVC